MTAGSTLANLTALWAARECAGVTEVIASDTAHLSIAKAAHILGLKLRQIPTTPTGALIQDALPSDLSRSALVLTAGTTSTGAIDPLAVAGSAAWTHVDAAWAGPMRLTRLSDRLDGIEKADSVAVSAHKWFFQPKESALIFFKDVEKAQGVITMGGAYLAAPNVGILGSHGAMAIPLLPRCWPGDARAWQNVLSGALMWRRASLNLSTMILGWSCLPGRLQASSTGDLKTPRCLMHGISLCHKH